MTNYSKLPEDLQDAFKRYIEEHIKPGHFLTAILENNLCETINRADEVNRERIFDIVEWVYWQAPNDCWGSREKVKSWCEKAQT